MKIQDAVNELAVRLYRWSQHGLRRELEEGCPLLGLVASNNRRIGGFVSWNRTLSPEDRQRLARVRTFAMYPVAREVDKGLSDRESEYWQREYYRQTTIHMERLSPHSAADMSLPTFQPLELDRFLDNLAATIPSTFGKTTRKKSGVRCSKQIGDWRLVTEFVYERWYKNLTYAHTFLRKDDKTKIPPQEIVPKPFPRSLFTFWGLYNRTVVSLESMEDAEPMCKGFIALAEHFVLSSESLFSDLDI